MVTARGGHVDPSRREGCCAHCCVFTAWGLGATAQGGGPAVALFGEQVVCGSMAFHWGRWGSRVLPVPSFSICCSVRCPGRGSPLPTSLSVRRALSPL